MSRIDDELRELRERLEELEDSDLSIETDRIATACASCGKMLAESLTLQTKALGLCSR